jgi:glycosyltransferase involved in cell wall biosynthesis
LSGGISPLIILKAITMKIAYIGTYPPRECGIGTFTRNKFTAMVNCKVGSTQPHEGIVIAVNDQDQTYNYPKEVVFTIRQQQQHDYIAAAEFINKSGADICILEHEFGIYGGSDGEYVLSLLKSIDIPIISVFHTVLKTPSPSQKIVTLEIAKMAAKSVVMSQKAVAFLTDIYGIAKEKIKVIEHGVPDCELDQISCKKFFGLQDKKVLLTFGLIGRNKGIETVIKALPPIVAKHPDVVYIILGKTHPAVVRHTGEEYRDYLTQLTQELHLENNVIFKNEFVDEPKLCQYLSAADIYVTPYLNEAQITSGTLSYAVGAGCAVISTPYWHAEELLAGGRGRLFDFYNSKQLSDIFMELLDTPSTMKALRDKAYKYGRQITWCKTAENYILLGSVLLQQPSWQKLASNTRANSLEIPTFSLQHIRRMTDSTGLIQHAKYGIPNLKEGYCLDDNARALLLGVMSYNLNKNATAFELMPIYMSYIHYLQNDNGLFRNFLSFNRSFLDEVGSEDSFGRTIWAIGYTLAHPPSQSYYHSAREIFENAAPHFTNLQSIRGTANTLIGVSHYLEAHPHDIAMTKQLKSMADKMLKHYQYHSSNEWQWFEPMLTYDNGLLPLSLLHAGSILQDDNMLNVAKKSMDFLTNITFSNGWLSIIGNEKWYAKNGERSIFAQQPIDAMAMVLLFQKAYKTTNNVKYLQYLKQSFMWFLGENDLQKSLYCSETKGCFDGLESNGVNNNLGAESTLAYLISHVALSQTLQQPHLNTSKYKYPTKSLASLSTVNFQKHTISSVRK